MKWLNLVNGKCESFNTPNNETEKQEFLKELQETFKVKDVDLGDCWNTYKYQVNDNLFIYVKYDCRGGYDATILSNYNNPKMLECVC